MRCHLLLTMVLATGCATSLSSMHGPRVLQKGRWELNAGMGVMVPAGAMTRIIGDGSDVAKKVSANPDAPLDERAARSLFVAAAAAAISPPAPVTEFNLRYGFGHRLEAGLRYAGPAIRGEVHGQVLDGGTDGWHVIAGGGVARHTFEGPLASLLEKVKLLELGRTDFDVALLAGREWKFGSVYFGPKLVYSRYSTDGLVVDGDKVRVQMPDGTVTAEATLDLGSSVAAGGLVGFRVGWKYVFFTGELGVYGSRYRPIIFDVEEDLGGLVVYPAFGLVATW